MTGLPPKTLRLEEQLHSKQPGMSGGLRTTVDRGGKLLFFHKSHSWLGFDVWGSI